MHNIEQAIERLKNGEPIIVIDAEDRENEGDLIIPAEKVTPEIIQFMARHCGGLICLAMTAEQMDRLQIPLMPKRSTNQFSCAFGIGIDAVEGITTGISAYERAHTIQVASNPSSTADVIRMPGHIFPLRAAPGGLMKRQGHTEAAVELAQLANYWPAGVICEIMAEDGTMMRLPELRIFAEQHGLALISIADLIAYKQQKPTGLEFKKVEQPPLHHTASSNLPTSYGEFKAHVFCDPITHAEHFALIMGDITQKPQPLVRIHSECITGDIFGSQRCDCGPQLEMAMQQIAAEGCGVIIYLRQEGRGIGLSNKIRAYSLQEQGLDTVEANQQLGFAADQRDYAIAITILQSLNITSLRLLTNNPAKFEKIASWAKGEVSRVALITPSHEQNQRYLDTKKAKFMHWL